MNLTLDIDQSNLNVSHMGVMEGASSYFELPWSAPDLFVEGGHAFVTNVRFDLCPSGPYVWQSQKIWPFYESLGLAVEALGFLIEDSSSSEQRKTFDEAIVGALNEGKVCSLSWLDHQIVTGYDEKGFTLAMPWGQMPGEDPTPPRLEFGSWKNFSGGPPLVAFAMSLVEQADRSHQERLKDAVTYAIDLWDNPKDHIEDETYGMGPDAYPNWQKALDDGFGSDHGAWWNGMVWSECKIMASRYLQSHLDDIDVPNQELNQLADLYGSAARAMMNAADKSAEVSVKKLEVEKARVAESAAVDSLREILPKL